MVKDSNMKQLAKLRREKRSAQVKGRAKEQADYCNAIGLLLSEAGRLDEALEQHQEELLLCQALGDSIGEAVADRRLGEVCCELGRLEEALRHHRRFLEAAERQQDRLEIQRATATLGRTYLLQANNISSSEEESKSKLLQMASKFFQKSLQVVPSVTGVTERERAEMTARLRLNLGVVAESTGNTVSARSSYSEAAALAERHGLDEVGRRVHDSLAESLQAAGDYGAARRHLQAALRLADRLQDRPARADTRHRLAQVQLLMGELDAARRTWSKAVRLRSSRESDHRRHKRHLLDVVRLAEVDGELLVLPEDDHQARLGRHELAADLYCRLAAFAPALRHYQAQLQCAEKLGKPEFAKAAIYASLAQTHKDLGQYPEAKRWFERELGARQDKPTEVCKTLMNLADLEAAMGGAVSSVCEWYRRAAVEAGVAGLARLRVSALRDMADTYREHGRTEDEQRTRRDLALAERADNLPPDTEEGGDSSGGQSSEPGTPDGLSSESEEETAESGPPRRPGHAGPSWRNNKGEIRKNSKGETRLHVACIQGRLRQVESLLRSGHPVNVRDHSGWLPLHEAANFGHAAVVERLLRHGAEVNDPGGRQCGGVTPLHDAAGNGHLATSRLLLAAGADPAAANQQGQTPLQYLMHYRARETAHLTAEVLADLSQLELEMKQILSRKGHPIPDSPGAALSQSPSVRSARSSQTADGDSEELPPPPALSDEEEHAAAAYRRAIRGVGQSAVTADVSSRRRPSPAASAADSGLVTEAEYQWLEQDAAQAPTGRRRRRRRLSSVFASAGSGDRRSGSPPNGGGVRPVSPLWGEEAAGEPVSPAPGRPEGGRTASAGRPSSDSEPEVVEGPPSPGAARAERRPGKRQRQTQLTLKVVQSGRADSPRPAPSPSASPPAKQQRSSERPAGGPLRVQVEVERDRLLLLVPTDGSPRTVQWLAQQASERYYKQFLLRPRLELLKEGALLAPEDAVESLVRGQEDVLSSRVLDWERPPLPERYRAACVQLGQPPLAAVSARLAPGPSGRLELAELRLSAARLQPVLRAVQRYSSVTDLLLAGNPLRDAGAEQLAAALAHLPALRTLDLGGTQLTAAGLASLGAACGQGAPLGCSCLLLGHNLFSEWAAGGHLAVLVGRLPRLATLDLTSCQLTERHLTAEGDALCRALADCRLTELRLSQNSVSAAGAELLLRSLRPDWLLRLALAGWRGVGAALSAYTARGGHCCLQELELRHCRLADREADQLARALSGCRHLVRLDLSHNSELSGRGVAQLLDALAAAGCPLRQLQLAGCGGDGGPALARLLAGPAPLQRLTLPAGAAPPAGWSRRYTSPDGDLELQPGT